MGFFKRVKFFFQGKIASDDISSKISSLKDFKYKDFDEKKLSKTLGKKVKIINKKNICFPFNLQLSLESKAQVQVQKIGFDVRSWNNAVQRENRLNRENKETRRHYENLYSNYQSQLQTYQLARQTKKQTVLGARHNKGGAGFEMFWTAGDKRPTPPKKPNYHVLKDFKKEDFYTKDEGIETIKDLKLKHSEELNYFNFFDKVSFYKIFDISDWPVIASVMRDIYASSESKDLGKINSSYKPKKGDVKIEFKKLFLYSGSFSYHHRNIKEKDKKYELFRQKIVDVENKYTKEYVKNILIKKNYKMGKCEINSSNIKYTIKDINYLPFLRVEIKNKDGKKEVKIIDYITRSTIDLGK